MVSVVQCFMSKLLSPLWRRAQEDEEEQDPHFEGAAQIRQVQTGIVTHLCADYGLIDHAVYFTSAVVLGGVVLCVGDTVQALAVREGAHGQWRALRVERQKDMWESGGSEALKQDAVKPRPLIGTVTSCDRDGGLINQTTYFPRTALCEGFEPMKGDWVLAQYVISPAECSSQAQAVSPLRYLRMDGVSVTRTQGNSGVVEDSVFFSLESLIVPPGFRPARGDVVNVVVLESSQSLYSWRALCMTPVQHSPNPSELNMSDADIHSLLENKGGLQVSQETHFGSLLVGTCKELLIWIRNTGSESHSLKCCEFAGWDSGQQFCLSSVSLNNGKTQDMRASCILNRCADESRTDGEVEDGEGSVENQAVRMLERNLEIEPGEKVSVTLSCQAKTLGRSAELLLLHFSSFTIARRLEVSVSSAEESLLKPSVPYTAYTALPLQQQPVQVLTITAPPAPIRLARRHLPNFLGHYGVPQALRNCVEAQKDVLVIQPALAEPLSLLSMLPRFSALLWLEELEAERELREFSLTGAILRKGAVYLHLEVPGLTEGRPSLFIGDKVVLKKPCSGGFVLEYMSYITEITEDDLSLRVNADFQNSYLGEPLDVEFTLNRLTTRRCHCALEQIKHFGDNILFPSMLTLQPSQWNGEWGPQEEDKHLLEEVKENGATQTINGSSSLTAEMVSVATQTKTDLTLSAKRIPNPGQFFNVQLNSAQKEAIKRILSGECRPTPYILFGPPGTGKTITLIEAILQVYHRIPCSRVLVCTPSNSAADLVCMRLHQSGYLHTASLARVNATCRPEESMPEELRQYARAGEDIRHASFHRIVICTCSSAGMFYQIGLRVGHFTHVFLDEAGQATEPETLIPLSLLSETSGQIVLAGDPKQLGPVVKSRLASVFGLGVSLLERLMGTPLYSCSERGYNPLLVTKLVYNYRSHEALLELPSRLFYAGELCVRSQRAVVDALCHWNRLPTKGFPFIFHGVRGTEMREGSNPSWFNPAEAVQVMMYCCQLAKRLYNPIPATDIGVIAPYKKQVEKIRVLLHRVGLGEVKVGSVEEFQGQEYLIMILSTVRSNESLLNEELQSMLGFLSNPKRFNVAITRAKALLIVIGNPHILIKDPCFSALLQYSYDNRAFLGCDPPMSLQASSRILSEET
ncbi:RNA helicase Mov10l1 isoform X1 [Megalobrama amblycephala]|uniref:RNA helicase Mov10l1 isoform X1 n=1 Tax=Megalobrama amblycephala TaxID=75352 RepID=UPI00201462F7|nr:RNA helicase Mov10l1 isoform X1 [Megalobrama amblycephala]